MILLESLVNSPCLALHGVRSGMRNSRNGDVPDLPPEKFDCKRPEEWTKWVRRFDRFRQASGLDDNSEASQVNALVYSMGDEADDILSTFHLSAADSKKYSVVKGRFNEYFVQRRNTIFERASGSP